MTLTPFSSTDLKLLHAKLNRISAGTATPRAAYGTSEAESSFDCTPNPEEWSNYCGSEDGEADVDLTYDPEEHSLTI